MPRLLALHAFFETLGYVAAGITYSMLRASRGDSIAPAARLDVLTGAAVGALLGSRVLFWLSYPHETAMHLHDPRWLLGGKTVVGGLVGGWMGVELAKSLRGIRGRTGELFVLPLIVAIAIGRIGCFLAGPLDRTAGNPTNLPWGIAMGDSVRRHPVALYEIAFLIALAFVVERVRRAGGYQFRFFLASYVAFRFAIDFLKPDPPPVAAGLSAIQWACVAVLAYYALRRDRPPATVPVL